MKYDNNRKPDYQKVLQFLSETYPKLPEEESAKKIYEPDFHRKMIDWFLGSRRSARSVKTFLAGLRADTKRAGGLTDRQRESLFRTFCNVWGTRSN